jgi:hypothetical protein
VLELGFSLKVILRHLYLELAPVRWLVLAMLHHRRDPKFQLRLDPITVIDRCSDRDLIPEICQTNQLIG